MTMVFYLAVTVEDNSLEVTLVGSVCFPNVVLSVLVIELKAVVVFCLIVLVEIEDDFV